MFIPLAPPAGMNVTVNVLLTKSYSDAMVVISVGHQIIAYGTLGYPMIYRWFTANVEMAMVILLL